MNECKFLLMALSLRSMTKDDQTYILLLIFQGNFIFLFFKHKLILQLSLRKHILTYTHLCFEQLMTTKVFTALAVYDPRLSKFFL